MKNLILFLLLFLPCFGAGKFVSGSSQSINILNDSRLQFAATEPLSISFMLILDAVGVNQVIFHKGSGSGDPTNYRAQINSADKLVFFLRENASNQITRTSGTIYLTNTLYNITITYNGSQVYTGIKIYTNGIEETYSAGTTIGNPASITSVDTLYIAKTNISSDPRYLSGKLWDMKIVSRALSLSEVKQDFASDGLFCMPNTVIWLPFIGQNASAITQAQDLTKSGYTILIKNSPTYFQTRQKTIKRR